MSQHWRKPRKMLSNSRLEKHRFLIGYLRKSLKREERSSQSSSLSWCSRFGQGLSASGLQGRQHHPPALQEQRWQKILWQPQRHLVVEYSRKDLGAYHTELYHTPPLRWCRLWKSVCLQKKQRDNRHDIRLTTDQGKVPRAESEHVHSLCVPDLALR